MLLPEALNITDIDFFSILNDIPTKNLAIVKKVSLDLSDNFSY